MKVLKTGYFRIKSGDNCDYFHILASEFQENAAGIKVQVKSCIQDMHYDYTFGGDKFILISLFGYGSLESISEREYKKAIYEAYIDNFVLSVARKDKESGGQAFVLEPIEVLSRDAFLSEFGLGYDDIMDGNYKLTKSINT